jgi:hypothetical protein
LRACTLARERFGWTPILDRLEEIYSSALRVHAAGP